jgi:hypothetical protein
MISSKKSVVKETKAKVYSKPVLCQKYAVSRQKIPQIAKKIKKS